MKLISHRGNINGKKPHLENRPDYIEQALNLGYDVEIDIWGIDEEDGRKMFLGHDEPLYFIEDDFLMNERIWVHCKNAIAMAHMTNLGDSVHYFWHENDAYTITSKRFNWMYPGSTVLPNSIIVLPERQHITPEEIFKSTSFLKGICSDHIGNYKYDVNNTIIRSTTNR